tara:strand:+ start:1754 stop:2731 length:978 start_codon:yes stop_codon:yes gene_type:complete
MKVAICHTKRGLEDIMNSFTEGVVSSGDEVEHIKCKDDIHKLEHCDTSFQVAEVTRYESLCFHSDPAGMAEEGYLRVVIKNKQIEMNKQRIILDCGILEDNRKKDTHQRYFAIGVDGIKRGANFYNENSPSDRFQKRKIRIKEWRTSGDHILIIGQTHYGAGLSHVGTESDPMSNLWTDPTDYYHNLVKRVREYTDRPIVFRTHPIGDKEIRNRIRPPEDVSDITITDATKVPIKEDLKNAWCAITRTSNGAVDAVFNGIPVITEDPICLAYDVAEHSIKKIEKIGKPNRKQWLYDISYAEWSLAEMKEGLPWQRLRKQINASTK